MFLSKRRHKITLNTDILSEYNLDTCLITKNMHSGWIILTKILIHDVMEDKINN